MPALMLALSSCDKCKTTVSPSNADALPPYTETGANTFGCTVDGKVFKPQAQFGSSAQILQCNYQMINGYPVFVMSGRDFINNTSVDIGMSGVHISHDTALQFRSRQSFAVSAGCGEVGRYGSQYNTYDPPQGEFHIRHFDSTHNIISGTFWFDAKDTVTGKTSQVRDGRFDVHFTR